MNKEELINIAKSILKTQNSALPYSTYIEALEFLRVYAGEKSSFYKQLSQIKLGSADWFVRDSTNGIIQGFINYLEKGLSDGMSLERSVKFEVVSDFLEQANNLLSSNNIHPAAPTVLIGASLEEFLRNWVEEKDLKLNQLKPSLDAYAKILKEADLISKQDFKDITSWAGLRNHAAHGEWDQISDKKRILIMLEGVNLFMRKYSRTNK